MRSVARILAVAIGVTVGYALMPFDEGRWWMDVLIGLVAIGAIVPLTVRRVRTLKTTSRPTAVAMEALVLTFMMLIFGFSALYLTLNRHGDQFADMDTKVDAAYFAVSTLSTVGYGDIHATGQAGRMAVIAQILVDFTILAVSVRVLLDATRQRLRPGLRAPME